MFLIVQKSFFAIVKGLRFSKERVTNRYGDMRRNKKGKLPQKRQFTTVFALQIFAVDFRFSLCYERRRKAINRTAKKIADIGRSTPAKR